MFTKFNIIVNKIVNVLSFIKKKIFTLRDFIKFNILYLHPISYCLIFLIVLVSFYLKYYIISLYFIVTLFYLTFCSKILPCEEKEALKLQKVIDDTDYDTLSTNIPFVVTMFLFCVIGIYLKFLIAKIYLFALIITISIRFFGYKITNFFPFGIRLLKNIKKDVIVLKYHWYTHFKKYRNINHINLITLVISFVLGSLFAGSICSEEHFNLNYLLWNYLLVSHCVFVVSIDVYILFFMNMQSNAAVASTCIRCFIGLGGVLYCNYNLAESGLGPQTAVVNKIRPFFGTPQAHDNESIKVYKAMKSAFPRIDDKTYLLKRPDTILPGGFSAPTYEIEKTAIWDLAKQQDKNVLSQLSLQDQQILRVQETVKTFKNNKSI